MAVRTRRRARGAHTTAYTGPYAQLVNSSARRNGLDPWLLAALLSVESGFRPDARSSAGAVGIAQILLSAHPNVSEAEAQDPAFAIPWAARYLAVLKRHAGGSATGALRAYNTGSSKPSPAGNQYASRVLAARTKAKRAGHAVVGSALSLTAGFAGVDQGVDFTGKGAIPALAAGTVTDIGSSGIIEGGSFPYLVYQLTSGPYKGRHVYVAENFTPTVKVGQAVQAGQPIGIAKGAYPGIEIGFNKAAKGWDPQAPLYPNPHGPKAAGQQMLAYLKSLAHTVPAAGGGGTVHAVPVSLGGDILHGAAGVAGDVAHGVAAPFEGAYGLVTGPVDAAKTGFSLLEDLSKFVLDPGYAFLWIGFFVVGLAFLFLGIERLLGRSAVRDAGGVGKGLAVVAAPEAAPVMVGA